MNIETDFVLGSNMWIIKKAPGKYGRWSLVSREKVTRITIEISPASENEVLETVRYFYVNDDGEDCYQFLGNHGDGNKTDRVDNAFATAAEAYAECEKRNELIPEEPPAKPQETLEELIKKAHETAPEDFDVGEMWDDFQPDEDEFQPDEDDVKYPIPIKKFKWIKPDEKWYDYDGDVDVF
jgi:hypothetical protein